MDLRSQVLELVDKEVNAVNELAVELEQQS